MKSFLKQIDFDFIEIKNLSFSENLLIWAMRIWLYSFDKKVDPNSRIKMGLRKFNLDPISESLDKIMKLIIINNSMQFHKFPSCYHCLSKTEYYFLSILSNIQNRDDTLGKKKLSGLLAKGDIYDGFRECVNISSQLENNNFILPIRSDEIFYNVPSHNNKPHTLH